MVGIIFKHSLVLGQILIFGQGEQAEDATRSQLREARRQSAWIHIHVHGWCTLLRSVQGPTDGQTAKVDIPTVVTKVFGTRTVSVRVVPRGPIWRRHIDQLCPRYRTNEEADLGEMPSSLATPDKIPTEVVTPTYMVGRRGHNATSKSRLRNRSRVLELRSRVLELRSRVFESTNKRSSVESRGPLFTTCYLYCKVATSDKAITKFVIFLHDTTFAERYVSEDDKR